MIHTISGVLEERSQKTIVVRAGAFGIRIFTPASIETKLPKIGEEVKLYTFLHVRDGGIDLYGFLEEEELIFFEALLSVSGIGPKSALGVLSVAPLSQLQAAVSHGESELLRQSSGIGKKTAERIVLELKDKIFASNAEDTVQMMQSDKDVLDALINLGYGRSQAKDVISKIDPEINGVSDRLRDALKKIKS